MSVLHDFIQRGINAVEREQGAPPADVAQCLTVERIARLSLATQAGVRVGDILVDVDGEAATRFGFDKLIDPKSRHRYRFFRPSTGEWLRLISIGAPLGVEMSEATASILERARAGDGEYGDLGELYARHEWIALERASKAMLKPRLLYRIVAWWDGLSFRHSPALLMLGVARFEQGDKRKGISMIREYHEKYEEDFTIDFAEIASKYLDRAARSADDISSKDSDEASEDLSDAVGKPFACDYELPREDDGKLVSLATTLRRLESHQIMVICLVAGSRVNGPYDDFIRSYIRLSRHFAPFLTELHVITETHGEVARNEDPEFVGMWIKAENEARELGVPLSVLYDEERLVTEAVYLPGTPHIMIVDHKGTVLCEGIFDEVEFWDALASACKMP